MATEASVPLSIRLPKTLLAIVDALAKTMGVSAPDVIRSTIEQGVSSEFRILVLNAVKRPQLTLSKARKYAANQSDAAVLPLEKESYAALLQFWHRAYALQDGIAQAKYTLALLDVIESLIAELPANVLTQHDHYLRGKLGIQPEESYGQGLMRIKNEFQRNPSVGWAKALSGAGSSLANDLSALSIEATKRVFDPHLKQLMPLATYGARDFEQPYDYQIDTDLHPFMPTAMPLKIGGLTWSFHAHPFAIVITEGHHCFAFKAPSLLSFASGVESGAFQRMLDGGTPRTILDFQRYTHRTLVVAMFQDQYHINESEGYRLTLSRVEFAQLVNESNALFKSPSWLWLLAKHREIGGDY